jgi:hypothetical protein
MDISLVKYPYDELQYSKVGHKGRRSRSDSIGHATAQSVKTRFFLKSIRVHPLDPPHEKHV